MPTPTGGKWTGVKRGIGAFMSGGSDITAQRIIGSTIAAAGGLSLQPSARITTGAGGGGGGGASGGGGSHGGRVQRNSVARVVSGLAGFGSAIETSGLGQALISLGIEDLRGRSAGEVITRIADHLAQDVDGLAQDILRGAIQQALLSAAELADDPSYNNLEASLQTFLLREGIEGLIELFLTQYVFDRVWLLIEDYVNNRTDSAIDISNMEVAIEEACRSNVREEIARHQQEGHFSTLDWFGPDGLRVADTVVMDLEQRLQRGVEGGAA